MTIDIESIKRDVNVRHAINTYDIETCAYYEDGTGKHKYEQETALDRLIEAIILVSTSQFEMHTINKKGNQSE